MKQYKARYSQAVEQIEICEVLIEAEDNDQAVEKLTSGDFKRFLVVSKSPIRSDLDTESVKWLKR